MFERQNFRLILNDLDKYNEILNKFILKYLKLKSIRCNGMGGGHSSRRTAISFSFRIDPSRISVVSTRLRGEGEKRWRWRRERVSPLSTVFPQAVNALLGGFRPPLCVHRDPVPPRDISPPFSAFTSTLTSFSTTFSGTFYPPLLFNRTLPPLPACNPSLPSPSPLGWGEPRYSRAQKRRFTFNLI